VYWFLGAAMKLYEDLAKHWSDKIESGHLQAGDKLEPVRLAKERHQVSAATVVAAYELLQARGYIHSRQGSGFYVNALPKKLSVAEIDKTPGSPQSVHKQDLIRSLFVSMKKSHVVNLGAAVPDNSILPQQLIQKYFQEVLNTHRKPLLEYEDSAGNIELRRLLAKRMAMMDCPVAVNDIVVTNGCQEGLYLVLQQLTQPGDMVAIESPTYYGVLQIFETLQLKAIEIPTDEQQGISLDALKLAFEHWPIKACIVISSGNNPQGFVMDDTAQEKLVNLCKSANVALIEDDIYGDLHFSAKRPGVCRRFSDDVIYCSSFSKSLASGLRVGWVASRQLAFNLVNQKTTLNIASPGITQMVVAQILLSGKYEKHLRKHRLQIMTAMRSLLNAIAEYFPAEINCSQPSAGYVVWIKLPDNCQINGTKLTQLAIEQGIAIVPGLLFSTGNKYENYIRLSSSGYWDDKKENAVKILGEIIKSSMPEKA
jgi:DNA-binding transcriptional MocR family regulator